MKTLTTFLLLSAPAAAFAVPIGDDHESAFEHPFETDEHRVPAFQTGGSALIRGATVHSAVEPARVADVLVRDGRISAIGRGLDAPQGVLTIDAEGKHLAPGVVDTHSHMAIDRGINEGTLSITADCDITDVINSDDVTIYRALAGGVTTIQCLHGSANSIGGRSEVLKLRWRRPADELRFPDAPQGIKFALGENVKRSNWGSGDRYPTTRPGVESVFKRAFERAREYAAEWSAYETERENGSDPPPPRRDVRLDVLVGILEGEVSVHSHCYRADEILMLLRVAETYGFRIKTLQHVLEGYKIADEIAKHGAGTSTFSDWWSYKQEAYDAIPQNAALLDEAGALSTINSDSAELVRHLYHEAGKSVRYAGMDPVRALALATKNGAMQLGVGDRVGTIEVGKDADLALLDHEPMSVYARVEWTMVDGEIQFTRRDAFGLDDDALELRPLSEPAIAIEAGAGAADGPVTAIVGGRIHPVTSDVIEEGTLLVRGDRIVAMGAELSIPDGARVIDAAGHDVWPGLIALDTSLGLMEIGSVKGTQDTSEIGGNQPDLRVASSIHAASAHIGVTRTNGITRSQTTPKGSGPMQGQSAIVRLTGDTWEEMLTVDRDMLHIRFPRAGNRSKEGKKKEEPEAIGDMRELLDEAREYGRLGEEAVELGVAAPPYDPRLEALVPYANGEARVGVHADNAQTILYALRFVEEEGLDAVLYGASEGWKVADAIAASGLPIVVGPVLKVVSTQYDPYDSAYANAAVLYRAGCTVAIMARDSENTRNTPFHAGFAAAYGLPREEALRAITYRPAQILGIEDQLGSLAPGKIADVVITNGDIMETMTEVTHVMIDGELQDVGNRQTGLYEYYRDRLHTLQGK